MSIIQWLLKEYAVFLRPIKDELIVTQFLVIANYVIYRYAKNGSYKGKPLWVFSFTAFVAVVGSQLFDNIGYIRLEVRRYVSETISYYQLLLLLKNTGLLFGIDIVEFIIKNKNKK